MQRRSFFGILGSIGTLFGIKGAKTAETPVTNLPIVKFDEQGFVANVDELFRNAQRFDDDPSTHVKAIAKVYVLPQDQYRLRHLGNKILCGPMFLMQTKGWPDRIVRFYRIADTMTISKLAEYSVSSLTISSEKALCERYRKI